MCVCVFDIINPKLWGGLKSKESGLHQGCTVVSQLIEKVLIRVLLCTDPRNGLFLFGFIKIKQTFIAPARGHRQKPKIALAIKQNVQSIEGDKDVLIGRRQLSQTHSRVHGAHSNLKLTQRTFEVCTMKWVEFKLHCIRAQSSHFEG